MKLWLLIAFQILFVLAGFGQTPEIVVQSGHNNAVVKIAFSMDGKLLASGDTMGVIKLWDLSTNKEIRTIQSRVSVESLAFSTDGKDLFIASADRGVSRLEVISGQINTITKKDEKIEISTKSAINPAKLLVAQTVEGVYFGSNQIRVSSLTDNKEIFSYVLPDAELEKFSLPPTDTSGKEFTYSGGSFENLAFSPNGNLLIASTSDYEQNKIALINTANGKATKIVKASNVSCLAVSDDEKQFAVCEKTSDDEKGKSFITLRSAQTGSVLKKIEIPIGEATEFSFSPDGKTLTGIIKIENKAEALDYFKINYWNPATGKEIRTSQFEDYVSSFWTFEALKFSPDGKTLALGAGDVSEGRIYLRDFESGKDITQLKKNSDFVEEVRFLKNNLLFGGHRIWDLKTGKQITNFQGEQAVSSDGKKIVKRNVGVGFEILETKGGKSLAKLSFKQLSTTDYSIIFSPDDKYAITFCRRGSVADAKDNVRLFDANTGELLFSFPDNSKLVSFSPDGKLLAYSTVIDGKKGQFAVKIWDLEKKKQLPQIAINAPVSSFSSYHQLYDFYPVTALSFNSQSNLLAVGGQAFVDTKSVGFLDLYETETGKLQRQFGNQGHIESIEFSGDGMTLAAASAEKIMLFGIKSENDTRILAGHDSLVHSISFHEDGKIIASGGSDGQIIFWNYRTGEIISRLIIIGENDFILISPDNFYLASRQGAAAAVAFRLGISAIPFEQFDIRNNRPDLVLKTLGFASTDQIRLYYQSFKKRLRQNGLTESDLSADLKLPEVSIETKQIPTVTKEKILHFKVAALDNTYSLSKLNVYVNDVAIYGKKGFGLAEKKTKSFLKDVELQLTEGNNRIQVSVFNEKGVESIRRTFNIKYEGISPKPELYLVAVGVSKYKNDKYNLKYPSIDVANIIKLFENRTAEKETAYVISPNPGDKTGLVEQPKSFYQFHKLELTNENAVLEKINEISDFLKNAKPEDELVVFFSGHGLLDSEQNYYFATHDIDFKNPAERGISFEALENLLDKTAARRKVLLLDTCHAGEVDKSELEDMKISTPKSDGIVKGIEIVARSEIVNLDNSNLPKVNDITTELFADLRLGSGAIVVSASGGLEYAYESPKWSGGVFTYALRLALEEMKADANRDGKITIGELREFVGKNVFELTEGRQKPNTRGESVEFDFRVY